MADVAGARRAGAVPAVTPRREGRREAEPGGSGLPAPGWPGGDVITISSLVRVGDLRVPVLPCWWSTPLATRSAMGVPDGPRPAAAAPPSARSRASRRRVLARRCGGPRPRRPPTLRWAGSGGEPLAGPPRARCDLGHQLLGCREDRVVHVGVADRPGPRDGSPERSSGRSPVAATGAASTLPSSCCRLGIIGRQEET